ncbi:MAG TPA: hypothetical protein GX506_07875 [Firmicutes bacterium]|nr:hypothetical protein [Bacillota bacterium]
MPYLMGIDAGTQSLRCCLFDLEGRLIRRASQAYPTYQPRSGWVEQNVQDWLDALTAAVAGAIGESGVRAEDIVALSYACTSCTVVALDDGARPLRPAIMWMDERAWRQAERVSASGHPVLRYAGGKESPQWMLPKAMWLAENEPEVFRRARWIVEQTDLLTYHLTGRFTISRSNAAAKWHYVTPLGGWPYDLLRNLGLEVLMAKWPAEVLPVGTPLGPVSKAFAEATGLSPRTLVVQGGVDSHAAMVGVGAVRQGDMALIIGTSTCHMAQSSTPIFADVWGPYPEAVADGIFTLGGGQSTTGSIIQWLVENVGCGHVSYQQMDELASRIPPGSEGLVALDFFQGNRTPFKDPLARGAIWGLTLRHGLPHIYRAFCEAVAYGTRAIVDNLEEHDYHVERFLAAGGGAKSRLWMQIHADVSGRPVQLSTTDEPTALGAAIWAGIGAGIFRDYFEAAGRMVRHGMVLTPDEKVGRVYDFYYRQYIETYHHLKPLMEAVAKYEEQRSAH